MASSFCVLKNETHCLHSYASYAVVLGEDQTAAVSSLRTVYFGHYTHPHKAVLQVLGYAMAKWIGKVCYKHVPSTIEEEVGGPLGGSTVPSNVTMQIFYRDRALNQETVLQTSSDIVITASTSYKQLGQDIRDQLFDIFGDTANTNDRKVEHIHIFENDHTVTGGVHRISPLTLKAADIKFTIKGESWMKFQNITLGHDGTSVSTDRHDVYANPLEGKSYFGNGAQFPLKNAQIGTLVNQGNLYVDAARGFGSFSSTDPANDEIDRMLEHPPDHKMFKGIKFSRHTRLEPGVMNKSYIKRTHTMTLNQWLRIYRRVMKATYALSENVSTPTSIGCSRWFAMDKMLHGSEDANNNNSTAVNVEYHLEVSAMMHHKRKYQFTEMFPRIETS